MREKYNTTIVIVITKTVFFLSGYDDIMTQILVITVDIMTAFLVHYFKQKCVNMYKRFYLDLINMIVLVKGKMYTF